MNLLTAILLASALTGAVFLPIYLVGLYLDGWEARREARRRARR